MKLVQYNPMRSLITIPREIERFFDDFGLRLDSDRVWNPSVDISESEEGFELKADLPGMKKEDINIEYKENVLSISGEKSHVDEKENKSFHRMERSYGKFERSFRLPSHIKADEIKASFKNGVLSVKVPKAEEAKAKEIAVS
jgi:HSP20 family protein